MDTETVEQARTLIQSIADDQDITLNQIIVFGSRSRDDYREHSDIDLVLVSPDFEDVSKLDRSTAFYLDWDYDTLPDPEFICLTPEEFEEKKQRKPHIVRTAVEEGISLA